MTANLPTIATWDKARTKAAVNWVAKKWLAQIEHQITPAAGIAWLEDCCVKWLNSGAVLDALKVVEAAEAGDHVAHETLVKAYWQARHEGKEPSPFVESYVGRASLRPAPHRGRGGSVPHENLLRNLHLAILVTLAFNVWGLRPTRSPASHRPCGASIVAAAARQCGIDISEKRLANLCTHYLPALVQAGGISWIRADQEGNVRLEWTKNLAPPAP